MTSRRPRILFVAEAVTLAHVARPMMLAQRLDPTRYDVSLATDGRYDRLFAGVQLQRYNIQCTPPDLFLDRLARGAPLFDVATLRDNVREDLALLSEVKPDLVIGDLRLSLAVSARLARVPFATITNAYWSPYADFGPGGLRLQVPEVPMTRWLGPGIAQAVFNVIRPMAFAMHCLPMARVGRQFGVKGRRHWDVRQVYSDADFVLYADAPGLTPMRPLPENHHYVGPLPWSPGSPAVPLPTWWSEATAKPGPKVYVTLGSSGRVDLLPAVLEALRGVDVTVLAATAGRLGVTQPPANAFVADYLPGQLAAEAADLVICNGGSPTTQQAIAAGKPVLALPANMDQLLNMQSLTAAGAGLMLRPCRAGVEAIRRAALKLLDEPLYREAAGRLRERQQADSSIDFAAIVDRMLGDAATRAGDQPMHSNGSQPDSDARDAAPPGAAQAAGRGTARATLE